MRIYSIHKFIFLLIFFILFPFKCFGLCSFEHNPPILCLAGKSVKIHMNSELKSKKKWPCKINFKLTKAYRPAGSYWFDGQLDAHKLGIPQKWSKLKGVLELYANEAQCTELKQSRPRQLFMVEWSCYDKVPELKDFSLMIHLKLKADIVDTWANYYKTAVDCSFLESV